MYSSAESVLECINNWNYCEHLYTGVLRIWVEPTELKQHWQAIHCDVSMLIETFLPYSTNVINTKIALDWYSYNSWRLRLFTAKAAIKIIRILRALVQSKNIHTPDPCHVFLGLNSNNSQNKLTIFAINAYISHRRYPTNHQYLDFIYISRTFYQLY